MPELQAVVPLGTVAFKNRVQGGRADVTLVIMDLVRTKSDHLRAAVDVLIVPIGLKLFSIPVYVQDGEIGFGPSRRDKPALTAEQEEFEFTFGFATKANRDIFWDTLHRELAAYCRKVHHKSLEEFLEVRGSKFEQPRQGTPKRTAQVRPPSPRGGVLGQRHIDPPRARPGMPRLVQ